MSSATTTRHRRGRQQQQPAQRSQPRQAAPAAPRLRARTGNLGVVQVQTLVLIELAAALVLVGWVIHPVALGVGGGLAAVLVVFALGRRRRVPLPEWIKTIRAMKRRGAQAEPVPPGVDAAVAPLLECEPSLRTYEHLDRNDPDQRTIGFVGDGTFLTAVVRVDARDQPLRPAPGSRPLPLKLLHAALEVDDIRLESVQYVQYTQPAPAPHLPEQAVAARSYAPLQAQTQTPGTQLTWVALKLDPELCPEAVEARGGGLGGAKRALLRAADQLASTLSGNGYRAHVLDERELISALGVALCVNPRANTAGDGRSRRTQETTRAWRCDDRWHTTYWISNWPQLGTGGTPLSGIAALLGSTRVMASSFSLSLTQGGQGLAGLSGYVRLAARSENELNAARREVERRAGSVKVGLVRLDREQQPGLLATLPLGGTR